MKFLLSILLLLPVIFFISCVEESPLSDVDVDDPSILKPDIFINKSIGSNSISFNSTTWIYDKNNNSVELRSGDVKLNGISMKLKHGLNNEPYYSVEPFDLIPFELNKTYQSNIILSDGEVYTSSITTREKDLYQLNLPSNHNRNNNMNLSWSYPVNDQKLILTMSIYGNTDTSSYINTQDINISNPQTGSYTIPNSYFSNTEIYKILLTLKSIITGEINKSFMNGSEITSTISISRTVNIQ